MQSFVHGLQPPCIDPYPRPIQHFFAMLTLVLCPGAPHWPQRRKMFFASSKGPQRCPPPPLPQEYAGPGNGILMIRQSAQKPNSIWEIMLLWQTHLGDIALNNVPQSAHTFAGISIKWMISTKNSPLRRPCTPTSAANWCPMGLYVLCLLPTDDSSLVLWVPVVA